MIKFDNEIKIIISIGNPGKKYINTRHNAGHIVIDYLIKSNLYNNIRFFESTNFMNLSGEFVSQKLNFYKFKPENLLVLHDDLDIHLGEYKIQFAKGPKVHNGIKSIEEYLHSDKFWRLRIGIENRDKEIKVAGHDYVLGNFTATELLVLKELFNT